MSEATFYQLDGEPPEARLPRLIELALGRGWRVEVRGRDAERMASLDLALWAGDGFLPHGLAGGPHDARQPVLLSAAPVGGRECLVLLDGAAMGANEAPERVLVVFDRADPDALAAARAQWKAVTAAGLPARYFVREGGGWRLEREVRPSSG